MEENIVVGSFLVMPAKEHDHTPADYVEPSFLFSEKPSKLSG